MPVLTHSGGTSLCQTCTLCSFTLQTAFSLSVEFCPLCAVPSVAAALVSARRGARRAGLGQAPAGEEPLSCPGFVSETGGCCFDYYSSLFWGPSATLYAYLQPARNRLRSCSGTVLTLGIGYFLLRKWV